MKNLFKFLAAVVPVALLTFGAASMPAVAAAAPAAAAKSQNDVKKGLRIFNQVVGHTGRLVAAKSYEHVAHENEEVVEGAEILRDGLKGQPADLKAKAEPLVAKAVAASASLAEISKTKDEAKVTAAHTAFADSVATLIAAFPEDMHPAPPKK
jgi:hypothetical protein